MRIVALVALSALTACGNIHALTAQTLDCPEEDVKSSEDVGFGPGRHEWQASCRKDLYDCVAESGLITCTPRDKGKPVKTMAIPDPPPPPPR